MANENPVPAAGSMEITLAARDDFAAENAPISASRLLAAVDGAGVWTIRFRPGSITVLVALDEVAGEAAVALVTAAVALPGLQGWRISSVRTIPSSDRR